MALSNVSGNPIQGLPFAVMWFLATSFLFLLNRFGGIELVTGPEASVRFFQGNKTGELTVYESELVVTSRHSFISPNGAEYQLEELPVRVVHDQNRGINSGSWKLRIINADDTIVSKLPEVPDFAVSEDGMTFYGDMEQPE